MTVFSAKPTMLMNHPELQQFAQQLSVWTKLVIENGRTPFRRVDLYPKIHTDQGILQPPLVFWINRQSMMAGGILLLPEQSLDAELERGRSCCAALGLKYFATWENDRVRIWRTGRDAVHQHQQFNFKQAEHPDSFRHLLGELLEALKLLAVIGLVPPSELSPHYLHNLLQTTLDLALPALVNSYRSQRAKEALSSTEDADQLASEAVRLLLLQLLGLIWHQQLPSAIMPEKFERAIELSLPQLPDPLRQVLSLNVTATPPALPHETAVCFHHLQLRLRQLSWQHPAQRAIASIEQLIASWYAEQQVPQRQGDIQLYPQSSVIAPTTQLILSDSAALLAAIGLQQDLRQQPHTESQLGNLFQLNLAGRNGLSISGTLTNQRLLSRNERHQYTTLLRTSWPNRRFRIGGDKPLWFWELVHLLGLGKNQQKLSLTLPHAAVQSSTTEAFWPLLLENYSIRQVTMREDNLVDLELLPGTESQTPTSIVLADETRSLPFPTSGALFRNQLLLALRLPAEIYQLLGSKLVWATGEELDDKAAAGLQIYRQSQLWHLFEHILKTTAQGVAGTSKQQPEIWPRPDILHLKELASSGRVNSSNQQIDPDRLLAELLQIPIITTSEIPCVKNSTGAPTPRNANKDLQEELLQLMQREGIPTFPEQYLYFLEQSEMVTYRLVPPLTIKSELLGEVELEDAAGQKIQVYGEELANALLLCSALGKTEVELPRDRQQLVLLQQHYWQDITQLHKQLNRLCHSRLQNSKDAIKLAKKVWKKLQLPKLP